MEQTPNGGRGLDVWPSPLCFGFVRGEYPGLSGHTVYCLVPGCPHNNPPLHTRVKRASPAAIGSVQPAPTISICFRCRLRVATTSTSTADRDWAPRCSSSSSSLPPLTDRPHATAVPPRPSGPGQHAHNDVVGVWRRAPPSFFMPLSTSSTVVWWGRFRACGWWNNGEPPRGAPQYGKKTPHSHAQHTTTTALSCPLCVACPCASRWCQTTTVVPTPHLTTPLPLFPQPPNQHTTQASQAKRARCQSPSPPRPPCTTRYVRPPRHPPHSRRRPH